MPFRDPWANYDNWKTSPPEDYEEVFCYCEHCDGEIYMGEEYIRTADGSVHEDCFRDFAVDILIASYEYAERN